MTSAPSAGGGQAGCRPLSGQLALELRERCEKVKGEAPAWRRRVDSFFQGTKRDAALIELGKDADQVLERSAQTVEPPDDQRVAFAHVVKDPIEYRPAVCVPEACSTKTREQPAASSALT
jgi:hypothetical protein